MERDARGKNRHAVCAGTGRNRGHELTGRTAGAVIGIVPRISQVDFSKRMERGEIVVIDVRDAADYTAAHIPGAMHIPLSFIQGELPYLPRGKPIVTYCT